jgi:hypothetical protein
MVKKDTVQRPNKVRYKKYNTKQTYVDDDANN